MENEEKTVNATEEKAKKEVKAEEQDDVKLTAEQLSSVASGVELSDFRSPNHSFG